MHNRFQIIKPTKNQRKTNEKITSSHSRYLVPAYRTYYSYVVSYGMLNTSHNTQPQHTAQLPKNTDTMISPARRLPAASILQVSAIAVRRAIDLDLRNMAMQFFYVRLTVSLFYCLLFCMPLTGVHGDKRYVF
jgi:hypothetical protein